MSLTYRWLGVAGLELVWKGYTLLVDPFFTRPPKRALLSAARVHSDEALVERYAPRADAVLVTHAHYDHLLDVPTILRRTGACAYGSPNTRVLLNVQGIPAAQTTCVRIGDQFNLGPFQVTVYPARHTPIPFARYLNGPLPASTSAPSTLPPRLTDYRMDDCFSFHIQVEGQALLVGNAPVPTDGLFISPYHPLSYMEQVLRAARPCRVVLVHWEDFTLPLDQPLKPMLLTPAQGLRPLFPPIRRVNLAAVALEIRRLLPGVEVEIPQFNIVVAWDNS